MMWSPALSPVPSRGATQPDQENGQLPDAHSPEQSGGGAGRLARAEKVENAFLVSLEPQCSQA